MGGLVKNLTSLKFHGCAFNDLITSVFYLGAVPSLMELSFQRCSNSESWRFSVIHSLFSSPTFSPGIRWQKLRVLDVSGTILRKEMLDCLLVYDPKVSLTHLYAENCVLQPIRVPGHSKIEFISLAGSSSTQMFKLVDGWAAHPTVIEINASGCELNQGEREDLVRKHVNVLFNFSVEFQESVRIKI